MQPERKPRPDLYLVRLEAVGELRELERPRPSWRARLVAVGAGLAVAAAALGLAWLIARVIS